MSATSIMPVSGGQRPGNRQLMRRGEDIDPFLALRREMDRVFDDLFRGFGMASFPLPAFGRLPAPMLAPHVDVSETDQEVRVTAELPGIDEKDVGVDLSDDILTIRGEKRVDEEEKARDYRIVERARGSFSRSLRLPFKVEPGQVQATVKDGILTITIPKPREVQEKTARIAVTRQDGRGDTPAAAGAGGAAASSSAPASAPGQQQAAE